MGDSLIGFTGEGYTLLASTANVARSVVVMKKREDKILPLDQFKILGASGDNGDRAHFTEFIKRNMQLYELRLGYPLTTHGAANFTRGEIATALRQRPYQVNMLLGGYDADVGSSLYFLDYMGALHKQDYATQGYAGYFTLSLLDKEWKKGLTLDQGKELLKKCIEQLRVRFVLDTSQWTIKYVDSQGVHEYQV
ncbi:proteasome subunit beta type-2-A-like [Planoprotostelium fungivorum]|uniref:Proteasome subunit beta n=1 Tax=Planoprotostelium fungivorum TaxID=1890364 RepID=A0A2P6NVX8_9EUKA|nr:proteasome subunit beta type-2-A-like [Planoprotostelium fungivorum]